VKEKFIKIRPDLKHEQQHNGIVVGIDEVGRGPWAGPVVAAAVIFHSYQLPESLSILINDSKQLTEKKRNEAFQALTTSEHCSYAIAEASVEEIDQFNIKQATFLAMQRCFEKLNTPIHIALVDGNDMPKLPCKAIPIIGGDRVSLSIAAASILAKVYRDELMTNLSKTHPGYGWETNAGYGTKLHQEALQAYGVTPHHRRSFAPIKLLLEAA
jgi:ribonuclease HII